ncbi:Putative nucleoside hydrolase IunH [Mycobacteroides abscessus subsp. abscessus]|nr:Putative nucleoside hydrolase IunH [Mycobacteroides abscessus subsp. abscessus]
MVPVFADVDTGVDDALGLIYLLASEDVEIVGIASTAGNVSVDHVCANNLGLLELCKAPQIPVSKGDLQSRPGARLDGPVEITRVAICRLPPYFTLPHPTLLADRPALDSSQQQIKSVV